MTAPPSLKTQRLLLRPYTLADAPQLQQLAGDRAIAEMTLRIPHPYEDGVAEKWIASQEQLFADDKAAILAIVLGETAELIGSIGLEIDRQHQRAEMGYFIGKPFWGRGYCTEAARAVLRYGFEQLGLHRIFAHHMTRNRTSGRVLRKIGMSPEGSLRHHVLKWGEFQDMLVYGILKSEFDDQSAATAVASTAIATDARPPT